MEYSWLHFNQVRKYLIELARLGHTTTYMRLQEVFGIPNTSPRSSSNYYLNNLLWDLDSFEYIFQRPPISSFVNSARLKRPGKGFYDWAKLRLTHSRAKIENDPGFLHEVRDICKEYWLHEGNYKLYSGDVQIAYK